MELDSIRERLSAADAALVDALAARQRLVFEVAQVKAHGTGALRDVSREEDVLTRVTELGRENGLDPFHVTRLFREILGHSLRTQESLLSPSRAGGLSVLRVGYQGSEVLTATSPDCATSGPRRGRSPTAAMTVSRRCSRLWRRRRSTARSCLSRTPPPDR